jgi:hypothetical protein
VLSVAAAIPVTVPLEQRRSRVDGETMVTVGVDTHTDVPVAAVLDPAGRLLETASFPATTRGYAQLATWAESFGPVDKVGMGCHQPTKDYVAREVFPPPAGSRARQALRP